MIDRKQGKAAWISKQNRITHRLVTTAGRISKRHCRVVQGEILIVRFRRRVIPKRYDGRGRHEPHRDFSSGAPPLVNLRKAIGKGDASRAVVIRGRCIAPVILHAGGIVQVVLHMRLLRLA